MFGVVPSVSLQTPEFLFVVSDTVSFSGCGVQNYKSTLPSASLSVVKTAAFVDAAEREK